MELARFYILPPPKRPMGMKMSGMVVMTEQEILREDDIHRKWSGATGVGIGFLLLVLSLASVVVAAPGILYDFEIIEGSLSLPDDMVFVEETVNISVTLKFRSVQSSDPVEVAFYLKDPDMDPRDTDTAEAYIGGFTDIVLQNNITTIMSFTWVVDRDPGSYELVAVIDPASTLGGNDYQNLNAGTYDETYQFNNVDSRLIVITHTRPESRFEHAVTYPGYGGYWEPMDWSQNGDVLAIGRTNGNIVIIYAHDGSIIRELEGIDRRLHSIAFSPDDDYLLAGGGSDEQGEWVMWSTDTWEQMGGGVRLAHSAEIWSVSWSPDGSSFMTTGGQRDRVVYEWDTASMSIIANMSGHTGDVFTGEWSPDGAFIATGGAGASIIWNGSDNSFIQVLGGVDRVRAISWNPTHPLLAVSEEYNDQGDIFVYDTDDWSLVRSINLSSKGVDDIEWDPDGNLLAASSREGGLFWILDGLNGEILSMDSFDPENVNGVAWNHNGSAISVTVSSSDRRIMIFTEDGLPPTMSNKTEWHVWNLTRMNITEWQTWNTTQLNTTEWQTWNATQLNTTEWQTWNATRLNITEWQTWNTTQADLANDTRDHDESPGIPGPILPSTLITILLSTMIFRRLTPPERQPGVITGRSGEDSFSGSSYGSSDTTKGILP